MQKIINVRSNFKMASIINEEESFICEICKDCWIDRDPRILNCQHTFCSECIKSIEIKNSIVICPICKGKFHISKRYFAKTKKSVLISKLYKNGQFKNLSVCLLHKKVSTHFCKTHDLKTVCKECLLKNHQECDVITLENYHEIRKTIAIFMETINKKQENIKKDIDCKEQGVLKEYKRIRETMEISFHNLKSELYNGIKNDELDKSMVKTFEETIYNHLFAEIPAIKNISSSFTTDFDNLLNAFSNLSLLINDNSFLELMENFNLSFRQLSITEWEKIKTQSFFDNRNFTPSFFIQLRNENMNCSDIFLLDRHILSKKDFDNIATVLKMKFKVEAFCIKRNMTMNDGFSNILNVLENSSDTLVNLAIINCNLNENQARNLGKMLVNCNLIETINLSANEYMKEGLVEICNGLRYSFDSLKSVDFSICNLYEEQCKGISKLLKECVYVENINLHWNDQAGNGLIHIFKALENSARSLRFLNLSMCGLNKSHCVRLGQLFQKCPKIEMINFEHNIIMGKGFPYIVKGLENSVLSLKDLNFCNQDLTRQQPKDLADLLIKCPNIETVSLARNPDMGNGFAHLCHSLGTSSESLKNLDFSDFKVNDYNRDHLKNFLKSCSRIESIALNLTDLSEEQLDVYESLKNSADTLKKIELRNRIWSKNHFRNIERFLRNCTKIEVFDFSYTQSILCGEHGFNFHKSLARSFITLKVIKLGFPLSEEACENFAQVIKKCPNIESVEFSIQYRDGKSASCVWDALGNLSNSLKRIAFKDTEVMESSSSDFINFIKSCTKLEGISARWNKSLKTALMNSALTLREISLRGELNEESCRDIGELLKNCPNIEFTDFGETVRSTNGLLNIYKGLIKSSSSIKGISLGYQAMNENQFTKLTELWKNCSNFTKRSLSILYLPCTSIGLGHSLIYSTPKVLRFLNFVGSELSENQCETIGELVYHLSQIEYISLAENKNMGDGIITVLKGLRSSHNTLKKMNFQNTNMKESHCIEFGNLLKDCKIEFIVIGRNEEISNGFVDIYKGLLNSSKTLKTLNVGYCGNVGTSVKNSLTELLKSCCKIEDLCLAEINFDDSETENLCQGLKRCCYTLMNLDLKFCNLNFDQGYMLSETVSEFCTLKRILLEGNDEMGDGILLLFNSLVQLDYTMKNFDQSTFVKKKFDKLTKRNKKGR